MRTLRNKCGCITRCTQVPGGGIPKYVSCHLTVAPLTQSHQKAVEAETPGATIVPVILSSDKTQVTLFRNKAAYPVYMTIGNIPKYIRRRPNRHAYILVAYLPTTKLEHITVKAARRRAVANLFHACQSLVVKPLEAPARTGVEMTSGDGIVHRGHTIVAVYVADYQDQTLVTAVPKSHCPTCPAKKNELDSDEIFAERDIGAVLDALETSDDPDHRVFVDACKEVGIKPIVGHFYRFLPYSHIFRSIAPDILHQLYQGVIKYLVLWIKTACNPAEIDARCRRLPPNHHIRLFMSGITTLSWLSGQEHADICRILLGLVVDLRLNNGLSPSRLVSSVRALLDCLYLAQYPLHSTSTLQLFQDALDRFDRNKQIFIDLGIREHFNINKFHFLKRHYIPAIKLYGTTDNYNTEYTERLHIDLAKDAYRSTNRKDEYPQMTAWVIRKEKIHQHTRFLMWRAAGKPPPHRWLLDAGIHKLPSLRLPKHPTRKAVTLDDLEDQYGATLIRTALAKFFVKLSHPQWSRHRIDDNANHWDAPFRTVAIYHKVKLHNWDEQGHTGVTGVSDSIHAIPSRKNKRGSTIPGRFDTVIFRDTESTGGGGNGVAGAVFITLHDISSHLPDRSASWPCSSIFRNPPSRLEAIVFSSRELSKSSRLHRTFLSISTAPRASPWHVQSDTLS